MDTYTVIGGGLAGLTAANALAETGARVTLYEQSERLGGRALTQHDRSYLMNLGPHALYAGGIAARTLREWAIPFSGQRPATQGWFVRRGERYPVFANARGLLRTRLFGWREKIEAARILALFQAGRAQAGESAAAWVERHTGSEAVWDLAFGLIRVATYCADLDYLDAAAALTQVGLAFRHGVLYIDGGWETLVAGLAARARRLGVEIHTGEPACNLKDGSARVVLAVPPDAVERIAGVRLPSMRPIRAAVLNLGLRRLPAGAATFALGLDRPLYFSVHSAAAKLAPEGRAVVHLAHYGTGGSRAELEEFADLNMAGWRDEAEVAHYLPDLTVAHAAPGIEGRPAVGWEGFALAGDWVGAEGMLADAVVASGLRAAEVVQNRKVRAA